MRLFEFTDTDVPEVGDILEIELGDEVVETVITGIDNGDYICETDNDDGYNLIRETEILYKENMQQFSDMELAIMEGGNSIDEAEYQGRSVKLGKPMQGDVKKFKVYVKNPTSGKVVKVNFGDPNMRIKKSNPARRKSFRARHNCSNPGPRTKARYWSCRKW
jgi:hypothetical protein